MAKKITIMDKRNYSQVNRMQQANYKGCLLVVPYAIPMAAQFLWFSELCIQDAYNLILSLLYRNHTEGDGGREEETVLPRDGHKV